MTGHPVPHTAASLERSPGMAKDALDNLREMLGTVAPRDPHNRRLGPRRWRLDLLGEVCERETFGLVTEWLASERYSVRSKQNYADDVRHWARVGVELCGTEPWYLGCITADVIPTWRLWAARQRQAPRTLNRRLSSLNSLVEFARYKTRLPLASPVSRYDRPQVDAHDEATATPILEVTEFQRVVAQCATARQALVPVLIYTLAGRVSECCNATLDDLHVTGEGCTLVLNRKGGKNRAFPLPDTLCSLVGVATAGRVTGPLLLDDADRPMSRFAVDYLLNRLGRLAGVLPGRDLTPHTLRASKLTHMHDEGADIEEIRRFADHANTATTLRYIRRRDNSRLKARHAQAATRLYDDLVARWLPGG